MNAIVIRKIGFEFSKSIDQAFDVLKWVLRAVSKDPVRKNLCCIHSDGSGRFAATDGHRLHVAEIPEMAERIAAGCWEPIPAASPKILVFMEAPGVDYPMYDKVIPQEFEEKEGVITPSEFGGDSWWFDFFKFSDAPVNMRYLSEAIKGGDKWIIRKQKNGNPGKTPITLTYQDDAGKKTAIIMPLKY